MNCHEILASTRSGCVRSQYHIIVYMCFLLTGVNAFNSVLAVFETERNMYYRHKAALMYDQKALLMSFTFAELPFILLVSFIFVVIFYFTMGLANEPEKFFLFYLFVALSQMVFTYVGQMFSSLFRDSMTAQGAGGLFIGMTVLFTGVLIRPSEIPDFWIFMYWIVSSPTGRSLVLYWMGLSLSLLFTSPILFLFLFLLCVDTWTLCV